MAIDTSIYQNQPSPLEMLARVQAIKGQQQQQQIGQQQLQGVQLENQQKQVAIDGQRALDQAMSSAFTKGPDGSLQLNHDAVVNNLTQRGLGHLVPGVLKNFNETDKSAAELSKAKTDAKTASDNYVANSLLTIHDAGYDPNIAVGTIAHAREIGLIPPDQAAQMASQIAANPTPETVKALIEPLLSKSPEFQKLLDSRKTAQGAADRGDAAKANAQREQTESNIKTPGLQADSAQKTRANAAAQLGAATSAAGYTRAYDQLPPELQKQFPAPEQFDAAKTPAAVRQIGMTAEQQTQAGQAASNAAQTKKYQDAELANSAARLGIERQRLFADTEETKLTPEARDKMAEMFATTGQLPTMGNGRAAAAVRSQVINRAAEMFPDVQFATNKAAYQANSASLKKAQANLDAVDGAEKTAGKNLQVFLDIASKVPDSGSPWLNKPIRLVDQRALGNADMAAFSAARTTAIQEIAKVLNNPNGSAAVSDSARHEVEGLIGPDATMKQIMSAAKVLQQDMRNRHESYQQQIDAIGKRIGGKDTDAAQPNGAAKATHRFNLKTGQIEEVK